MGFIIALVIIIFLALWVQHDAKNFRAKGVSILPGIWSTAVFLIPPLILIYLLVRFSIYVPKSKTGLSSLPPAPAWTNWILVILVLVIIVGLFLFLSIFSSLKKSDNLNVDNTPVSSSSSQPQLNTSDKQTVQVSSNANINTISPLVASIGDTLTIKGSGFGLKNNEILFFTNRISGNQSITDTHYIEGVPSVDGTTITFVIPKQTIGGVDVLSGNYQLVLVNRDSNYYNRSNIVSFQIK